MCSLSTPLRSTPWQKETTLSILLKLLHSTVHWAQYRNTHLHILTFKSLEKVGNYGISMYSDQTNLVDDKYKSMSDLYACAVLKRH